MSMTASKRRALKPRRWDGAQPAATLSTPAILILEHVRVSGDLGRNFRVARVAQQLGLSPMTVRRAAKEIRASAYAGQFRPARRPRIPETTRVFVLHRDNWECRVCGERNQTLLTMGHYPTPYSRGGSDHHTNLRVECRDCNHELADSEGHA